MQILIVRSRKSDDDTVADMGDGVGTLARCRLQFHRESNLLTTVGGVVPC